MSPDCPLKIGLFILIFLTFILRYNMKSHQSMLYDSREYSRSESLSLKGDSCLIEIRQPW